MSSQEDNTRELLQRLPKVDAPIGLEQRLRKRITAGEGKGLLPVSTRRASAPWIPYSIAASVILVMIVGYRAYRHDSITPPTTNQPVIGSVKTDESGSVSSPPGSTNPPATIAKSSLTREQAQVSSATVDKSTGNTHRDDPSDAAALKLTGGTAMESMVPRATQLSQVQQNLASPVSQTMSPYGPGISNQIRSLNRPASSFDARGESAPKVGKTTYYRHPKVDTGAGKVASPNASLRNSKDKPSQPNPRP